MVTQIALVGDFNDAVTAHQAIPVALQLEAEARGTGLGFDWCHTGKTCDLERFDGLWVVPASPYANPENAFAAIRHARETDLPFLGTCGGYQHALVEYARNVLGYPDAGLAEDDPECEMPLVSALTCALVEVADPVYPVKGSRFAELVGDAPIEEQYHCSFGLNPDHAHVFDGSDFEVAARDGVGAVRAMALKTHPFFLGTAFQPERAALRGQRHPVVTAFVDAVMQAR